MFTKKSSSLIVLFLMVNILLCQLGPNLNIPLVENHKDPIIVKGQIIDAQTSLPLAFASIYAYSTGEDKLIGGVSSDAQGNFEISLKTHDFYIITDYISYQSQKFNSFDLNESQDMIDLGQIFLYATGIELDDIEIRAEKSETVFSLDKHVFNVGKDLANRGGTAEDILDNVPSVSVDIDGGISLRGSAGVRILIDGKPSGLVGRNNGLKSIPASMIDKIEVITNPSARYEAEGMAGIINIILKKNQAQGFNGAFDLGLGYPQQVGAGANINYRKDKINWFLNYGLNYRENPGSGFNRQERITNDTLFKLNQDFDMLRTSLSNNIRFGADYFFNSKTQLTTSLLYNKSDDDNFSTVDFEDLISINNVDELLRKTIRTDDEIEDERNQEYSINFRKEFSKKEHELLARIQFNDKTEIESSKLTETLSLNGTDFFPDQEQRSANDEGNQTLLMTLDYKQPFDDTKIWEGGIRSSLREIRNKYLVEEFINNEWLALANFNNDFDYDEQVHAGYLIYGNEHARISYQLGLRVEYTHINTELLRSEEDTKNSRDTLNFFPSGHFNYKLSETNSVQLSYSRRIRRPRFFDLNPFFTFVNNRNFFGGNPNINPEYTDSYEFSNLRYWENGNISTGLFYRKTSSSINRIIIFDRESNNTLRIPLNIGDINDYGIDVSGSYTGLSALRIDGNITVFKNKLRFDQTLVENEVNDYLRVVRNIDQTVETLSERFTFTMRETDNISWTGRLTARIKFLDSDLQIRANYRGPRDSAQGRRKGMTMIDLGWSRDFFSKRMTLTLSARDILNGRKRRSTTILEDFKEESEFQWRSRFTRLTISYRINQKKKSNKRNQDQGFNES